MATTAKYALRYPGPLDQPLGPAQIQNLAEDCDSLGLVGASRRTADSATITTTETIVANTSSLTLAASSAFALRFFARVDTSVVPTDAYMRIRDTNVIGVIRGEGLGARSVVVGPDLCLLEVIYRTTISETKVFVGTLVRTAGTGTIIAKVPTHLMVTRLGPSALVGDF